MTQDELVALCRKWQRILRLQDWDVKVRLARTWDMQSSDNLGECSYELRKRMAAIRVLDSVDYDSEHTPWPQDQERTLVHELLHLHFAPFAADSGTPQDIAQEQAIDAIAGALVQLARGEVHARDADQEQSAVAGPSCQDGARRAV